MDAADPNRHSAEAAAPPEVRPPSVEPAALPDPDRWVTEYGDYLFNYALGRLRNPQKAEDMVQETFLAALKGRMAFAGRGAERSWLVGILRHKVFDHCRKTSRETPFTDLEFYSEEEREHFLSEGLFAGTWIHKLSPSEWERPGASLDKVEFWKVFHECASRLPPNIATVFMMREVDGVAGDEICALLNISDSNLWVMLHRARLALRRCLESNWFKRQR